MKKYIIYIGILALGLFLGWVLFGSSSNSDKEQQHEEKATVQQLWTCSMHTQIMLPEPGNCPICGMKLIPLESGAAGLLADQFSLTDNAMALANIQTSVVGNGMANDQAIKLSGKIVENEESNAVQVSYFSGRIEKLNISFTGEAIRKGQLLATIYSPELYAAQQELLTAASLKQTQPALYKAVRNKLKLWKLSESQINDIESSGKVLENFPIYATVSGTVSEKLVAQGDFVKEGQALLKIANFNTVWANFDVYENQVDFFKKGQEISISTNADPNKVVKAKVAFIDPVLDLQTRTVKLRAVLNNANDDFKPGMFVEGRIEGHASNEKQTLSIPATAVLWTGERSVVYVKTNPDKPVFEMREITLGNAIGDRYEVLSGLEDGQEIVTNGAFTVDAAAQLQGKKSMMNKAGGETLTGHEGQLGTDTKNSKERIDVSVTFQEQLKGVFENYIELKDALVNDDAISAKKAATTVTTSLAQVDMKLLSAKDAHTQWMTLKNDMLASANAIAATTALQAQRDQFIGLSLKMTSAVEIFGINEKIYRQFCPMANDDQGAYWLSKEAKVRNPYYGKAMHSCGSVEQTID